MGQTQRLLLITLLGGLAAQVHAADAPSWGYEGETGPSAWGGLDPAWSLCATGRNQSPVDITHAVEAELAPLELYPEFTVRMLINNGETEQAVSDQENILNLDGAAFPLVQMHFHAPSENRIEGRQFPLEAHLVHANAAGELAVVAVLFEAGAANQGLIDLGNQADGRSVWPERPGMQSKIDVTFPTADLLPANRDYYRFNGSLTTPPCTEGVRWLLLKTPATASTAQINAVAAAIGVSNNRPVQPLNARVILR